LLIDLKERRNGPDIPPLLWNILSILCDFNSYSKEGTALREGVVQNPLPLQVKIVFFVTMVFVIPSDETASYTHILHFPKKILSPQ